MAQALDPHAHLKDRDLYERYYNVDTKPNEVSLVDVREPRLAWAANHVKPTDAVLDVGCHKGEIAIPLALLRKGAKVTGVDIGGFAIEQARAFAAYVGTSVMFERAWAEHLPYPSDMFDVTLLLEILEHVADTAAVIAEAERVTKPGGQIVISSPVEAVQLEGLNHDSEPIAGFEGLWMHVREYNPSIELAGKQDLNVGVAESPGGIFFYLAAYTVQKDEHVLPGD